MKIRSICVYPCAIPSPLNPEKPNRKILDSKKGAIDIIEKAISNYKNEGVESLNDIIERIERIEGIKIIERDNKTPDKEAELF